MLIWGILSLYGAPGLALAWLRFSQGAHLADALFAGLFWPVDVCRHWIEWGARLLLEASARAGERA